MRPALHAEHGVEVIRDERESALGRAGVQRVVAAVAGDEARLLVAEQVVHGEVPHPRIDIHPAGRRRLVRLAKRAEEFDQVGVVVLPRIGLLGVIMQFRVRCRLVAEICEIRVATALVEVAVVVVRELPANVLRVQRVQLGVVAELVCATELFVVLEHTHRPGTGSGQTGEPEQRATEFLSVRVDGI